MFSIFKKQLSENEIIERLRNGDESVIASFYKQHFTSVKKYVLGHGGTAEIAQEFYHDAIIILTQKLKKPDFVLTTEIGAYLMSIVRNKWLYHIRDDKTRWETELNGNENSTIYDDIELPEITEEQSKDIIEQVMEVLEKMGNPCKKIITEFYYLGRSMKEIAEEMNYQNDRVAITAKSKCMTRLTQQLAIAGINI
jgi:RNA polymerase sigma factor (sigma-70 family)